MDVLLQEGTAKKRRVVKAKYRGNDILLKLKGKTYVLKHRRNRRVKKATARRFVETYYNPFQAQTFGDIGAELARKDKIIENQVRERQITSSKAPEPVIIKQPLALPPVERLLLPPAEPRPQVERMEQQLNVPRTSQIEHLPAAERASIQLLEPPRERTAKKPAKQKTLADKINELSERDVEIKGEIKVLRKKLSGPEMSSEVADEIQALNLERDNIRNKIKDLYESRSSASSSPTKGKGLSLRRELLGAQQETLPLRGGKGDSSKGLSNFDIDSILGKYPEYLGCISHDEIPRLLPYIKPKSSGGFVINTDPHNKPGQHWQSIYFDARGKGKDGIDFFDSYGDPIDKKLLKDIKLIADALHSPNYLKFKENRIQYQNNVSGNCGWFAAKFLADRFRGLPWKDATGYDDSKRGEKAIEHMKYRFFPQQQTGGNLITGKFYDYWPKQVQKYITPETISSLQIGRYPISSLFTKALDLVSLGGFSALKKRYGYDDLFHLFFIINGKYKLERNHLTSMTSYTKNEKEEDISVTLSKPITIADFLNNGAARIGPNLQRYSASSNNCQVFILQMLSTNNIHTSPQLMAFIKQDVKSIFDQLPITKKIADAVTDVGHLAEKTYNEISGNGYLRK